MKTELNSMRSLIIGTLTILSFSFHIALYSQITPSIEGIGINEQIFTFNIGKFKCVSINDGDHYYPLDKFFANVPLTQIEDTLRKYNLPIESMYSPYTHLIVNTGRHLILMDMGMGGNLARNMKTAGINPSEIDIVIITHAHPDHIGGTLDKDGNPVYPNAQYYIQKSEWDFWFSDQAFEMTNEWFINKAREQLGPVQERMNFIVKDTVIQPGVKLISAPGHTPGHMIASFSSDGDRLYYAGDVVLNPLHLVYPDWLPVYDIEPAKAATSKKKIFDLFADEKAWVIAQHFPPFPSLGLIEQKENKWIWQPVIVDFPEFPRHQIRIVVTPKNLPGSSNIYITGNQPEIGEWNPAKVPLKDNKDGSWSGTFAIKENKQLEFKITRGSWDKEAANIDGQTLPNNILVVQKDTTLIINIENWKDLVK